MDKVLFGSFDMMQWYRQLTKQTLDYPTMLKDEKILANLYLHAVKNGSHILYTPTQNCYPHYLEQEQMYSQMEAIVNLCVTSAKQAIQKTTSNALIAGSIQINSTLAKQPKWLDQLSELAIYLADFGVDSFIVHSEECALLEPLVQRLRIIDDIPIAAFLKPKTLDQNTLADYTTIAEKYEIELLGFQLNVQSLKRASKLDFPKSVALGYQFNVGLNTEMNHCLTQIQNFCMQNPPTMVLASPENNRQQWHKIQQHLSECIS